MWGKRRVCVYGIAFLVIHGGLGGQRRVCFVCVGLDAMVISWWAYCVIFNSSRAEPQEPCMSVFDIDVLTSNWMRYFVWY